MYEILVRVFVAAALYEFGMVITIDDLSSERFLSRLEYASQKVLQIKWRPIIVFADEAARFH